MRPSLVTDLNTSGTVGEVRVDWVRLMPDGCIVMTGWAPQHCDVPALVALLQAGAPIGIMSSYRLFRPDVKAALGGGAFYLGFEIRFQPLDPAAGQPVVLEVCGTRMLERSVEGFRAPPPYAGMRDTSGIVPRSGMYGSGPPVFETTDEILALAQSMQGKTLDFGCGAGYLLSRMRASGVDAWGVEIDRPEIHQHLAAEMRPYVTLTDGSLPLPYGDGNFESAIAVEVVEHVDDPVATVAELARIVRSRLVVTVPDASAIPDLSYANVVPWHMLESTHFSFFTEASLRALLQPHFATVEVAKIGRVETDGIPWYTSVVAVCSK